MWIRFCRGFSFFFCGYCLCDVMFTSLLILGVDFMWIECYSYFLFKQTEYVYVRQLVFILEQLEICKEIPKKNRNNYCCCDITIKIYVLVVMRCSVIL